MIIRKLALAALTIAFTTACGGSSDTPPGQQEKSVENQDSVANPSNTNAVSASESTTSEPAADAPNPFAELPAPYNTADFATGKRVYRQCSSCHLTDEGAGHLVGPNLHGLFSRKSGGLDDFTYSKALEEADFTWTPEKVDEWLADPRGFLKGNRMSFAGVRKEKDRLGVIAYLMIESGDFPVNE